MRGLLTTLLLPPLSLVLAGMLGGLLAWRCRRWARLGGALAVAAGGLTLLLATPFCSDALIVSLEAGVRPGLPQPADAAPPAAIIVLGGDGTRDGPALDVGPLTLERLRAGAALHRRTGLPLLVTAGRLSPDEPPLAPVMAKSLMQDFGVPVRWVEPRAGNTRENAVLSAEMLRDAGIGSAFLVTHGWHMPRAQAAFARISLATTAEPVRRLPPPAEGGLADWIPRADYLAMSWFALREWAGRLVYTLVRD